MFKNTFEVLAEHDEAAEGIQETKPAEKSKGTKKKTGVRFEESH